MRTRSFLIDNTFGKMYANVTTTATATAANVIAGSKLASSVLSQGPTTAGAIANNLGNGSGIKLGYSGLLVGIKVACLTKASKGPTNTTFRIKYGNSGYSTSTTLLCLENTTDNTWVLPYDSTIVTYPINSITYPINLQWSNNENFYVDVISAAYGVRGLSITFNYYLG
jgi:hypothetical protein